MQPYEELARTSPSASQIAKWVEEAKGLDPIIKY
jgi:hypothetical protein